MNELTTLRTLLAYSDATNRQLFQTSELLSDPQLDSPFEMGMGTLRKTLAHIYVGEAAWLERWKWTPGFKWSSIEVPQTPAQIREQAERMWKDRDAFLETITPAQLTADQTYLDSTAGLFNATLHEMILQGIVHSTHHRAQAVNMIRRVGGPVVDVDFMYSRRRPAQG